VTRRGLVRSLLIVAMAVLYPFHWDIRWINVSLGDGVVALILCLLVFQAAASKFPLPRYVLHAGVLIAVIAVSMIANTLSPPGSFFSLRDSEVEVAKLFAVIAWMVSVCWVVSDDFPPRYLLWSTASVLVACAFAMLTVYENLFLRMDRPTGPFDNANLYGNYLMLNVFLALGAHNLLTEDRTGGVSGGPGFLRAARILFLVGALPALAIGIMSSGSRGTLLGTTIGLLATVSWRLPRRLSARRLWVAALGTVALVATIAWFLAHGPFHYSRGPERHRTRGVVACGGGCIRRASGLRGGLRAVRGLRQRYASPPGPGDARDVPVRCGRAGSTWAPGLSVAARSRRARQPAREGGDGEPDSPRAVRVFSRDRGPGPGQQR